MPPAPMTHDDTHDATEGKLRAPSWLGVDSPVAMAVELLLGEARQGPLGEIDLEHVLLVTPGGRASRYCLDVLWAKAKAEGRALLPPRSVTPGSLDVVLRGPLEAAIANPIEIRFAVMQAIQDASKECRSRVIGTASTSKEVHAIADRLIAANRDLAMAERTWSNVADAAESMGGDGGRYRAIEAIVDDACARLEAEGLLEPEQARAELRKTPPPAGTLVVLLGVVEVPKRVRSGLADVDVWPMVLAEETQQDTFDSWGGLVVDAWSGAAPKVALDSIQVEDKPIDVAEAVVERLAEIASDAPLDPAEVSVVLADESMAQVLDRELRSTGCPVHMGQGRRLGELAPTRELLLVSNVLRERNTDHLRALFGHPACLA
ncbi:MAG: hypothetical protein MK085_08480, partial [Phycisphaerales bacterium]|nr:hypothetical protein [Phycisphaerales bacterium]